MLNRLSGRLMRCTRFHSRGDPTMSCISLLARTNENP